MWLSTDIDGREATDPWVRIRSVPTGSGPDFTYCLLGRGLSFGSVGPDPDWSDINIFFFLCKVVTVPVRFGLLWDRFIGLWNRWVG